MILQISPPRSVKSRINNRTSKNKCCFENVEIKDVLKIFYFLISIEKSDLWLKTSLPSRIVDLKYVISRKTKIMFYAL